MASKALAQKCGRKKIQELLDQGKVDEVLDGLSKKQVAFCHEYLKDFNGTAAVERAGYSTKWANRQAYELLENPAIKLLINKLTEERADKSTIKPDYVIKKVVRTIEKAEQDGKHSAVLKGCELLARHLGMFIERTEISGPNGDAIKIEQVKEAADAFTRSISSLIERRGEEEPPVVIDIGD